MKFHYLSTSALIAPDLDDVGELRAAQEAVGGSEQLSQRAM